MRYIIFTAVLMCLLGVEGKAQTAILISDKATNQTPSRIECVYGESLSENYEIHVPYNNGYYVEGTLYFADNAYYPNTDRAVAKMVIGANTPYNENGLQLDFIVMQKINHDDKKKYRFWFVR
ncbi:MAG: hypothetical protein IIU03_06050, partial [Bacteroidales bacterium]|nr:hypothetical protein [Bacteroidales bacterium]